MNYYEEIGSTMKNLNLNFESQWFQLDSAPAQTAHVSWQWTEERFEGNVICLNEAFEWSPLSRTQSMRPFFLWGHLKDCVYKDKPLNVQNMKENIIWYSRRIWSASLLTSHQWIQKENSSLCSETWSPSWACYLNYFYINLVLMIFLTVFHFMLNIVIVSWLCQMC